MQIYTTVDIHWNTRRGDLQSPFLNPFIKGYFLRAQNVPDKSDYCTPVLFAFARIITCRCWANFVQYVHCAICAYYSLYSQPSLQSAICFRRISPHFPSIQKNGVICIHKQLSSRWYWSTDVGISILRDLVVSAGLALALLISDPKVSFGTSLTPRYFIDFCVQIVVSESLISMFSGICFLVTSNSSVFL